MGTQARRPTEPAPSPPLPSPHPRFTHSRTHICTPPFPPPTHKQKTHTLSPTSARARAALNTRTSWILAAAGAAAAPAAPAAHVAATAAAAATAGAAATAPDAAAGTLPLPQVDSRLKSSLAECLATFGAGKVVLYSNSAGLKQYDPEGACLGRGGVGLAATLPLTMGPWGDRPWRVGGRLTLGDRWLHNSVLGLALA